MQNPPPRHKGENIKPATVNKEVICLKTIVNRAVRHGKLIHNPLDKVKKLTENNVRTKVLTPDEFKALVNACPDHIKPLVAVGYFMGMRRDEILKLTWSEVDLKKGFIRLPAGRTKTDSARVIPLHPEVKAILEKLPPGD